MNKKRPRVPDTTNKVPQVAAGGLSPVPQNHKENPRIEEAAEYSGFTVSYIRARIADNTLIPARAGKRFVLTRTQLDAHTAELQHQEALRRGVA